MVDRAEWKRRQSAPGPKTSPVAFGRDRRLPITSRWREHEAGRDPGPGARSGARTSGDEGLQSRESREEEELR
jgi:NAD+ synthase (glutamine-hydrolysing)